MKKVTKINARGNSCNFCNRGILSKSRDNLVYPYDMVYQVEAERGLIVIFCNDCLTKLSQRFASIEDKSL